LLALNVVTGFFILLGIGDERPATWSVWSDFPRSANREGGGHDPNQWPPEYDEEAPLARL
jgi:hypothetical protein